jgi:hypothetical protein
MVKCGVLFEVRTEFLNNKSITEQVSNFNYLGCNVTYKCDEDLNDKLSKLQNICGENQERNKSKILQIMAVPVLLYDSETWTLRKRDWNRIQAAEMKYLRTVK